MIYRNPSIYAVVLVLTGCQGLQQVGQGIASNAPPAIAPTIALQDPLDIESGTLGVTRWPGESRMYVHAERRHFSLILRSGQFNSIDFTASYLPISSSPLQVRRTTAPTDPANNSLWTYVVDNTVLSSTDSTQTARYTFYSPVDGSEVFQEGRPVWIRAKEESINPSYRNTFQQFAESPFEVVPVETGGCTVSIFQVNNGYVDSKVSGCKEYVIDANGVEIRRERAAGIKANFPPDPTPTIGSTFVYTGADTIRLVAVDAVRRETFANKYKQADFKPPCLTITTVDNGDGKKTKFRVPC